MTTAELVYSLEFCDEVQTKIRVMLFDEHYKLTPEQYCFFKGSEKEGMEKLFASCPIVFKWKGKLGAIFRWMSLPYPGSEKLANIPDVLIGHIYNFGDKLAFLPGDWPVDEKEVENATTAAVFGWEIYESMAEFCEVYKFTTQEDRVRWADIFYRVRLRYLQSLTPVSVIEEPDLSQIVSDNTVIGFLAGDRGLAAFFHSEKCPPREEIHQISLLLKLTGGSLPKGWKLFRSRELFFAEVRYQTQAHRLEIDQLKRRFEQIDDALRCPLS